MKKTIALLLLTTLAGCGVETVGTAATAAALKKQEMEQAKQTMERTQAKVGQAMEQMQQSADQRGDATDNK